MLNEKKSPHAKEDSVLATQPLSYAATSRLV